MPRPMLDSIRIILEKFEELGIREKDGEVSLLQVKKMIRRIAGGSANTEDRYMELFEMDYWLIPSEKNEMFKINWKQYDEYFKDRVRV